MRARSNDGWQVPRSLTKFLVKLYQLVECVPNNGLKVEVQSEGPLPKVRALFHFLLWRGIWQTTLQTGGSF